MKGKSEKPNILLITTDQQRFDHIGLKGMKGIGTPALDRLGREGIHFDRAYTSSPTCTPARVSLLTGLYPSIHGAYSIGVTVDRFSHPLLPECLADDGYKTAIFGKTHFVCRKDESRHIIGHDDQNSEDYRNFKGPYLGFQTVQVSRGHSINQIPSMHYRFFLEDTGLDYMQWFPVAGKDYDHDYCGPWNIPEEYHNTTWVGNLTEDWIMQHDSSEPWFCWASFQDPHEPFACPESWYSKVDASQIEAFEGFQPEEFDDKPEFYNKAIKGDWKEYEDGYSVPSSFATPKRTERALHALQATLGMLGLIDHQVGRMLKALEKTGQLDNTIVIFTTDHGEMHGHHGFWGKGLTAYDDCQRIPMLIWGSGYFEPQGTSDAIVNLVDIPKTILSAVGADIPSGMQGCDLLPILKGKVSDVRDATIIECHATQKIYQQTMVTKDYKLVVYDQLDCGELYDMNADPDQYNNLWNNPNFAGIKSELMLQFVQTRMNDEGKTLPREAFA